MEQLDIFRDIAERTGGDIYIGVVGGVRTGKSTFIKRFMELLVIPNIKNVHDKERAKDELPQSGAGRTVMTTEPKFVPNEAVEILVNQNLKLKVRLVDNVGYRVEGAIGYEEEEFPRMVSTPWFEEPIPFEEAAEFGTRKVITEHSSIGLVITTDGSITDIPRENYVQAEERVVSELKEINKPFIIVLNSTHPTAPSTLELAQDLQQKYDIPVLPLDCAELGQADIMNILEEVLLEFGVTEVKIDVPRWIQELNVSHWLRDKFESAVRDAIRRVHRVRDIGPATEMLAENDFVEEVSLLEVDLGTGTATVDIKAKGGLFYQVIKEHTGFEITGEHDLFRLIADLAVAKREYDKVASALAEVRETGYGVVTPKLEEMNLEEPELIRQGNRFGVRLKASAPSLHVIRADITTEITPIIGTEKQCEELVRYILNEFEDNPKQIWNSQIFGKTLHDLVREGIQNKLHRMPENAQVKLQETLQRIVNDGSGGLICIII
ncbi:MAG: stage IV sporulation protein A [Eubacteriales bacterium]|jgi:stage IV sporulation protein A|nr:stage IV sporulation protein A [Bacillota bacterium]MBV1727455.1 stage IV sporulation protein A [Desulforudis sp.]MDZ4043654.1 stage IV sporulation protein A [Eubacteriales bacterium]MBU4532929.1 stage IV sporulation protein A [Bacillota bacterium]MBU4555051.1 stage IV sporulation protein A [Bacillota bacterium]